jgi:acyl carrier protein
MTELIIQWVRDNRRPDDSADPEITEDTDLMSTGLLDSFGFIDLLLFIENQRGSKVNLTDVDPAQFTIVKGLSDLAFSNYDETSLQPFEMARASNSQRLPDSSYSR